MGISYLPSGRAFAVLVVFLALAASAGFLPAALAEQGALANEPISPLPTVESLKLDMRKVKLGEKMFNDTRLSKDNTVSCASCHQFTKGGTDGAKTSVGIRQQLGPINAPTVFNAALNFRQFWDGRADSLENQIDGVVHNSKEFDSDWPQNVDKLNRDGALVQEFAAIYPDGIQGKNVKDAIAVYERSLLTPSRFDRYLRGDAKAISAEELKGYQLFKNYGCVACHQGVNVGGNMYQKFGVFHDYFGKRGSLTDADKGRYNVTQKEEDKHVFKVPTLRNIALTAPYFHDASATTLEQAVDVMFIHQLGRPAPAEDKRLILLFLHSLTGEEYEVKK